VPISVITQQLVRVGRLSSPEKRHASRVSGNVAAVEDEMDDYGETATATGQPPASQSWAEQMDQADEARAAAAEAIISSVSKYFALDLIFEPSNFSCNIMF